MKDISKAAKAAASPSPGAAHASSFSSSVAPWLATGCLSPRRMLEEVQAALGGGVEWMFLPNWSAKAEYLYTDLSSGGTTGTFGYNYGYHRHPQFNIVRAETLRQAQNSPESHRDLIVRVAGYSDYFCDLSRELQEEIIARTEHATF